MPDQWRVVHLNETVSAEFDRLPKDIKAKFLHLASLIEELGLTMVGEPYVKHLEGRLWEMRLRTAAGYGRGFYCAWEGRRVVVLRYFVKKSARTPQTELALARKRLHELRSSGQ
jgi:phage-related protein